MTGVAPTAGRTVVVAFWASYSDADYGLLVDLSQLSQRYPGVGFIGVSCDARRSDVERFVTRFGEALPELKIPVLQVDIPLAFDDGRRFRSLLATAVGRSPAVSDVLVVDVNGSVVWKEQFSLVHPLEKGQLEAQLARLVRGETLVSNGPNPANVGAGDDDEDEDQDGTDIDSGDSDGLLL